MKLIPIRDVFYFHADQKVRPRPSSRSGEDLIDDALKHLEQEFADEFVRIHRSALVAVRQIEALKKTRDGQTFVTLQEGSVHPDDDLIVSRRHLADVRRRVKGIA